MPHLSPLLFEQARRALRTTQEGLGERLGVSRRTAQRYARSGVGLATDRMVSLARDVHPNDPAVAAALAATMGATLLTLGIVQPAPPPPAPPPPPPPPSVVDAVVCAAAEAMDLTPRQVRAGLHAAFARAQEIGLGVDVVESALRASLSGPVDGRTAKGTPATTPKEKSTSSGRAT